MPIMPAGPSKRVAVKRQVMADPVQTYFAHFMVIQYSVLHNFFQWAVLGPDFGNTFEHGKYPSLDIAEFML